MLTGCPWQLDYDIAVFRLHVAVKERSESRQTRRNGRDTGLELLVNHGALRLEPAEVDQVSRALRPMAATHLALTFANHLFEVEPSL